MCSPEALGLKEVGVKELRWGIVGTGKIADLTVAPAIASTLGGRLVAVASRNQVRAEKFAARHGVPRAYSDYSSMLADPTVDAVFVATPNAFHRVQVELAAAAGKHVLCDKPLATNAADAAAAEASCRAARVQLGVNFQTRHHPLYREVRRLVESRSLGRLLLIEIEASVGDLPLADWRNNAGLAGMGALFNIGVHGLDLARFLVGAEVVEIAAILDYVPGEELERTGLVLLRFDNGTLGYLNANQRLQHHEPGVRLSGSAGRIVTSHPHRLWLEGELRLDASDGTEEVVRFPQTDSYTRVLEAFHRAVTEGAQFDPSGMDGVRCAELTDAIARSARDTAIVQLRR
jgi:1,5-anhydro-D-fructose reductase (1,5-anhydro-D-mannitol-forming)